MELLKIRFMKEMLHFILWKYSQRNQQNRMLGALNLIQDLDDYETGVV